MSQFIVILIVILMPGIISLVICDKIVNHSKWTSFKFCLYAVILGVFCYVILQCAYYMKDIFLAFSSCQYNFQWTHLNIWYAPVNEKPIIYPSEIIFASVLSFPISLAISYLINYKIFNKIAQKIKVSQKYGDENLFSYYLNAREIDWLYIRDIENNLTYQGRIVSYSENDKIQEIVLSEVTVYEYQASNFLYEVPTIYLAKELGKFIIESIPQENLG
jgi:hypothetical protein